MRTSLLLLLAACGLHTGRPTLPAETRRAVVVEYMQGKSLDDVASEYRLARDDAREVVHDAMVELTRRYYRDR